MANLTRNGPRQRSSRSGHRWVVGRDNGSASVMMLGFAMVMWASMATTLVVAAAIGFRHRVAAAADLSALSAASTFAQSSGTGRAQSAVQIQACAQAETIAAANGATLTMCEFDGSVVDVTAAMPVAGLGLLQLGTVTARARAGPG